VHRHRFLDKTLLAIADVAEQAFFSESHARMQGLLQSIDVRIKLVSFAFLLVVVSLLHSPQALWVMSGAGLLFAIFSRIPLRFYLGRVLLIVPLFSAIVVLPALLNIITPGETVLVLAKLDHAVTWGPYTIPAEIAVTRQGIWGAITFVSRVAASVSFAVLLTVTTRWSDIFSGLRSLFVPRVFVMTLAMTERYIFVLLRLIQDLARARKSRTIHPLPAAGERSWVASRIGFLFRRSMELSHNIYQAMLSRGYHGEAIPLARPRAVAGDYLWLVFVLLFGGIMLALERGLLR